MEVKLKKTVKKTKKKRETKNSSMLKELIEIVHKKPKKRMPKLDPKPSEFKEIEDSCCNKDCLEKIPFKTRKQFFNCYWAITSHEGRCGFINNSVVELPRKGPVNPDAKRKFHPLHAYYIRGVKVCLKALIKTLQVSPNRIKASVEDVETEKFNEYGEQNRKHGKPSVLKEGILAHIKDTYWPGCSIIKDLWPDYQAKYPDKPVSATTYHKFFSKNFKLKMKNPDEAVIPNKSMNEEVETTDESRDTEMLESDTTSEKKNDDQEMPEDNGTKRKRMKLDLYFNPHEYKVFSKEFDETYCCSCDKKCIEKIPLKIRQQFFKIFWNLTSMESHCAFIGGTINYLPKKDKWVTRVPKNKLKYFIKGSEVCREGFMGLLQISPTRIHNTLKLMEYDDLSDAKMTKIPKEIMDEATLHIKENYKLGTKINKVWSDFKAKHPELTVYEKSLIRTVFKPAEQQNKPAEVIESDSDSSD